MAKLGSYFGLCPIIDQKSLLGVQNDSQSGQVLVTLGKNIAIKFKISDQKQLVSWRTKDKFTSPVIYCKEEQKYCAVFSENYIRFWSDDDEQLDKHKKLKFDKAIYTIITCEEDVFIVFQNGNIVPLQLAILNRKELNSEDILQENHKIIEVLSRKIHEKTYIGLLVEKNDEKQLIWTVLGNLHEDDEYLCVDLRRDNSTLSGCVLTSLDEENVHLLSLWSDGKLYSHELRENSKENQVSLIDFISCNQHVTMQVINNNYLAMYGADKNEEGAVLVIYNVQFKVPQCKQLFKMFTSKTKLWNVENTLYLCVGQNLAAVPYSLKTEQLSALVGSHSVNMIDPDIEVIQEMLVFDWETKKAVKDFKIQAPNEKIREWATQGHSESSMLDELLPAYIANRNVDAIKCVLDYFLDVSDVHIASLLSFLLSADGKVFKDKKSKIISQSGCLEPEQRRLLVDKVLKIPFSDTSILPFLRRSLNLDSVMILVRYICYLLSEEGHSLDEDDVVRNDRVLIEWGCALLDANYQKFLLNKRDEKVVETLTYFNELVNAHLCCLDEFRHVAPVAVDLLNGGVLRSKNPEMNSKYCIEEINLY